MDDVLDIRIPAQKVYNANAAAIAAFLGGPLAAAYIIGHNYRAFVKVREAYITWILSILILAAILATSVLSTLFNKLPNIVFPVIFAGVARAIVSQSQNDDIIDHIERSGQVYTVWRAVLISLVMVVITVGIFVAVYYALGEM